MVGGGDVRINLHARRSATNNQQGTATHDMSIPAATKPNRNSNSAVSGHQCKCCWYARFVSALFCVVVPTVLWVAASDTVGCSRGSTQQAPSGADSSAGLSFHRTATSKALEAVPVIPEAMANNLPPVLVRPTVVLFGDSLTQYSFDPEGGWGSALAHYFQRKVDVINRGHSGYNSRWGLKVFEQLMAQQQQQQQQVELLTIWLGANDGAIPGRSAEQQHVPVQEYANNLRSIVQLARKAGVRNILLMTPPPVYDEGRIKHQQFKMGGITTPVLPDRTLAYMQQYAQTVLDLAKQLQLPVVDLYSRLQQVPDWQTVVLKDGLHFTPAGSMAVWQEMQQVLAKELPQLNPDAMPFQFPVWDRLAVKNFEDWWSSTALPQMRAASTGGPNTTTNKTA